MRIDNRTRYETGPLRELAWRVAKNELDPEKRRRVVVIFEEPARGVTHDGALGLCHRIGGDRITIYLPKDPARLRTAWVAHTLAHEFAHARGMNHSQMRGNPRYAWVSTTVMSWSDVVWQMGYLHDLWLTVRPPDPKRRPTDETRLANSAAHLRAWESRRRRAETGVKRWRQKVRYYEAKMAAARAPRHGGKG